jgi:predicted ribosome quality control (RQC) complex YloA/Tae2 family protein
MLRFSLLILKTWALSTSLETSFCKGWPKRLTGRDPAGWNGENMKSEMYDGFEIVYGTSARDNDRVTTELSEPTDFWFHAAGYAGTHLLVKNPQGLSELPREVERHAAQLAVLHSKAKNARGKIEVHLAWAKDVRKPKNFPAGKVLLSNYRSLKVYSPAPS